MLRVVHALGLALLCSFGALAAPSRLVAQSCGVPTLGPLEFTPADSSRGVTLNAPVRVRYSSGYFSGLSDAELATFITLTDGSGRAVAAHMERFGDDVLVLVPEARLLAFTRYTATARGRNGDAPRVFTFQTGSSLDMGPPTFMPNLSVTTAPVERSCDAPEGGYRVSVQFTPAIDDGPPADVEYLVYVTRGPNVESPRVVSRVRNFPGEKIVTAFVLAPEDAVEPVCVAVQALDGIGNVADGGPATCFEPIQGNYFAPLCSARGASTSTSARSLVTTGLAVLAVLGRVRRRRRRR